jgi:hypothetical protein
MGTIIIRRRRYGWIIKDVLLGLVFVVTVFQCATIYLHGHFGYEPHKSSNEPIAQVSPISNAGNTVANIVITATPAYNPPSE